MTAAQKTSSTNVASPSKHTDAGKRGAAFTTPVKATQTGIVQFSFEGFLPADIVYDRLSTDMKDCFTGSMPRQDFVDEFYPVSGERPPLPKIIFNVPLPCEDDPKATIAYYANRGTVSDVCRAINASGVCPSIEFVNTEDVYIDMNGTLATNDPSGKRKVDASGMLKPKDDSKETLLLKPNWPRMKVTIEFKLVPEDPVVDADPKWTPEERKQHGFVHQTKNAIHARGQATSYALHQFNAQSRTHVTSIVIMGRWARLLRYDHSGVIVTERFDWRADDGRLLADFLSRVEHANAQQDGVDDSVCAAEDVFSKDQRAEALEAMQKFSEGMLDAPIKDTATLRAVRCWDDSQVDENGVPKSRTLIATEPLSINYSIVGRYTISFIGYDVDLGTAYWVKDSWPIDRPGEFEKEGSVYARLGKAGVPHLAGVECAGEVRWKEDNKVQKSRTAEFIGKDWAGLTVNIHPLSHYRILFKDIGRPITKFESTHQLVKALSHAVEAHSVAYEKANVLHRDISAGNVLINRKGEGMLIDWDLALVYENAAKNLDGREPRLSWRTGTWAFLSCALLERPFDKVHELSDDLESFFWVLLYAVLRYRYSPVEWATPEHTKAFQEYCLRLFESKQYNNDRIAIGGHQKRAFLLAATTGQGLGHIDQTALIDMVDLDGIDMPDALGALLYKLRVDFKEFYAKSPAEPPAELDVEELLRSKQARKATSSKLPVYSAAGTLFANSEHMKKRFQDAISRDGWHDSDSAVDRFPHIHLPLKTRESLEKKDLAQWRVRTDDPTLRRKHDPANNLYYEVDREDAAADARRRLGTDFVIPKPQFGVKRALSTVDEDDEGEASESDEGSITMILERRDVSPPPKRQRMDSEGRPQRDAEGHKLFMEAYSG